MRENERPSFARLTSSSYDTDRLDPALNLFASTSLPAIRSKPGYLGVATLLNRDHNRVMAMTFWSMDARPDLLAFDPETMEDVLTISRNWASPLVRETYSVYVCELRLRGRVVSDMAHARLTTMRINPQYWDAVVAAGHEAVNALEREQPGFIGAIGLGDRVTGKATFVELWENRAVLRASETTAYRQERAARAVRMLIGVPQHSTYHIEQLELGPLRTHHADCEAGAPSVE